MTVYQIPYILGCALFVLLFRHKANLVSNGSAKFNFFRRGPNMNNEGAKPLREAMLNDHSEAISILIANGAK